MENSPLGDALLLLELGQRALRRAVQDALPSWPADAWREVASATCPREKLKELLQRADISEHVSDLAPHDSNAAEATATAATEVPPTLSASAMAMSPPAMLARPAEAAEAAEAALPTTSMALLPSPRATPDASACTSTAAHNSSHEVADSMEHGSQLNDTEEHDEPSFFCTTQHEGELVVMSNMEEVVEDYGLEEWSRLLNPGTSLAKYTKAKRWEALQQLVAPPLRSTAHSQWQSQQRGAAVEALVEDTHSWAEQVYGSLVQIARQRLNPDEQQRADIDIDIEGDRAEGQQGELTKQGAALPHGTEAGSGLAVGAGVSVAGAGRVPQPALGSVEVMRESLALTWTRLLALAGVIQPSTVLSPTQLTDHLRQQQQQGPGFDTGLAHSTPSKALADFVAALVDLVTKLELYAQQWQESQEPALRRQRRQLWLIARSLLPQTQLQQAQGKPQQKLQQNWQEQLEKRQARLLLLAAKQAWQGQVAARNVASLHPTLEDVLEGQYRLGVAALAEMPEPDPEPEPDPGDASAMEESSDSSESSSEVEDSDVEPGNDMASEDLNDSDDDASQDLEDTSDSADGDSDWLEDDCERNLTAEQLLDEQLLLQQYAPGGFGALMTRVVPEPSSTHSHFGAPTVIVRKNRKTTSIPSGAVQAQQDRASVADEAGRGEANAGSATEVDVAAAAGQGGTGPEREDEEGDGNHEGGRGQGSSLGREEGGGGYEGSRGQGSSLGREEGREQPSGDEAEATKSGVLLGEDGARSMEQEAAEGEEEQREEREEAEEEEDEEVDKVERVDGRKGGGGASDRRGQPPGWSRFKPGQEGVMAGDDMAAVQCSRHADQGGGGGVKEWMEVDDEEDEQEAEDGDADEAIEEEKEELEEEEEEKEMATLPALSKKLRNKKALKAALEKYQAKQERRRRHLLEQQTRHDQGQATPASLVGGTRLFPGRPHPLISPHFTKLMQHQVEGLQFLWTALVTDYESAGNEVEAAENGGVILAHTMGLGKTLTTICFLHTFFAHHPTGRALVVVPANVLVNFYDELLQWLPPTPPGASVQGLTKDKVFMAVKPLTSAKIRHWHSQTCSVLVISSTKFKNTVLPDWKPTGRSSKATKAAQDGLLTSQQSMQSGQNAAAGAAEAAGAVVGGNGSGTPQQPRAAVGCGPTTPETTVQQTPMQQEAKAAAPSLPQSSLKSEADEELVRMLLEGPSIVVADEAHEMKNPSTRFCQAMCLIKTPRRIALTGYPLQNNLDEYYVMICWVKPNYLGEPKDFKEEFVDVIEAGRRPNASRKEKTAMRVHLVALDESTKGCVQAFSSEMLHKILLDRGVHKTEHVLMLQMNEKQHTLYQAYLKALVEYRVPRNLLRDYAFLQQVCNTPQSLHFALVTAGGSAEGRQALGGAEEVLQEEGAQGDGEEEAAVVLTGASSVLPSDLADFVRTEEAVLEAEREGTYVGGKKQKKKPAKTKQGQTKESTLPAGVVCSLLRTLKQLRQQHQQQAGESFLGKGESMWTNVPKLQFLQGLLLECKEEDEKMVVFSQSLDVLDAVCNLLCQPSLNLVEKRSWFRIDGSTPPVARKKHINAFQASKGFAVMVVSTRAGAVGINLTSARRLVVFDVPWNPVHNAQAVARIHRMGQTRPTLVYRLVYKGTMEEHNYVLSVRKEELFQRVIDRKPVQFKGGQGGAPAEFYDYRQAGLMKTSALSAQLGSCDPLLRKLLLRPSPTALSAAGRTAKQVAEQGTLLLPLSHSALAPLLCGYHEHKSMLPEDPLQAMNAKMRSSALKMYRSKGQARGKATGAFRRLCRMDSVQPQQAAPSQPYPSAAAGAGGDPGPSWSAAASEAGATGVAAEAAALIEVDSELEDQFEAELEDYDVQRAPWTPHLSSQLPPSRLQTPFNGQPSGSPKAGSGEAAWQSGLHASFNAAATPLADPGPDPGPNPNPGPDPGPNPGLGLGTGPAPPSDIGGDTLPWPGTGPSGFAAGPLRWPVFTPTLHTFTPGPDTAAAAAPAAAPTPTPPPARAPAAASAATTPAVSQQVGASLSSKPLLPFTQPPRRKTAAAAAAAAPPPAPAPAPGAATAPAPALAPAPTPARAPAPAPTGTAAAAGSGAGCPMAFAAGGSRSDSPTLSSAWLPGPDTRIMEAQLARAAAVAAAGGVAGAAAGGLDDAASLSQASQGQGGVGQGHASAGGVRAAAGCSGATAAAVASMGQAVDLNPHTPEGQQHGASSHHAATLAAAAAAATAASAVSGAASARGKGAGQAAAAAAGEQCTAASRMQVLAAELLAFLRSRNGTSTAAVAEEMGAGVGVRGAAAAGSGARGSSTSTSGSGAAAPWRRLVEPRSISANPLQPVVHEHHMCAAQCEIDLGKCNEAAAGAPAAAGEATTAAAGEAATAVAGEAAAAAAAAGEAGAAAAAAAGEAAAAAAGEAAAVATGGYPSAPTLAPAASTEETVRNAGTASRADTESSPVLVRPQSAAADGIPDEGRSRKRSKRSPARERDVDGGATPSSAEKRPRRAEDVGIGAAVRSEGDIGGEGVDYFPHPVSQQRERVVGGAAMHLGSDSPAVAASGETPVAGAKARRRRSHAHHTRMTNGRSADHDVIDLTQNDE